MNLGQKRKALFFVKQGIIFFIIFLFILPDTGIAQSKENEISFDPSYIISDTALTNWESMSQEEIQNFLLLKGSVLASYRAQDIDGKEKLASQIIAEASKRHKINPQVLITLIQKEQTLITQPPKKPSQFDWATGFACPDGRRPIKKFAGFALQIDRAAWRLRYYINHPWEFPIGKGREARIDRKIIIPKNAATAALYNYTPHIWGNKLFWAIFQKWFKESEEPFGEGSLLRAQGEPGVWLISNGKRHGFPSKTIFLLGFRFKDVKVVPHKILEKYPIGEPMKFPNFSLVKTPKGKIYLIDNGKKREISLSMFRQIGFHPEEIIEISDNDLNILNQYYENGTPITSPWINETLLQDEKSKGVWLVKDAVRQAIIDRTILEINFPYQKIIKVSPEELEKLQIGPPVKLKNGTLITSAKSPVIYVVGQGKKFPIADPETFEALGYSWQAVVTVPEKVLNLPPTDQPLHL